MNKKITAYIGLGSNLNNPIQQIRTALTALTTLPQSKIINCSSLYRNPPFGPIAQPDFINAVVSLQTSLNAETLLSELQNIEQQQGRKREAHWGPRTLDLDLLLYAHSIINLPHLQIPHPGLHQRNFVLYPLAEIAPDLILPTGVSLSELLKQCSREGLEIAI